MRSGRGHISRSVKPEDLSNDSKRSLGYDQEAVMGAGYLDADYVSVGGRGFGVHGDTVRVD